MTFIKNSPFISRLLLVILAITSCSGVTILSEVIGGRDFLNTKQLVLTQFAFALAALLVPLASRLEKGAFLNLQNTLVFVPAVILIASDFLLFGAIDLEFHAHIFLIVICLYALLECHLLFGANIYKYIYVSIASIIFLAVMYIIVSPLYNFLYAIDLCNPKSLTELSFINTLSYVASFGILCLFLAGPYERGARFPFAGRATIYSVFPVIFLLMSKSKGAIVVAVLGMLVLHFRKTAAGLLIAGAAILFLSFVGVSPCGPDQGTSGLGVAERFMMFGRTADAPAQAAAKVDAMFTNRTGASFFWRDTVGFLSEHPLGVGTAAALSAEYQVPGKDVVMKTHSLLLIFLDSFGLIVLVLIPIVLWYMYKLNHPRAFALGLVMLLPVLVLNEPLVAFAIPLFVMMTGAEGHSARSERSALHHEADS